MEALIRVFDARVQRGIRRHGKSLGPRLGWAHGFQPVSRRDFGVAVAQNQVKRAVGGLRYFQTRRTAAGEMTQHELAIGVGTGQCSGISVNSQDGRRNVRP